MNKKINVSDLIFQRDNYGIKVFSCFIDGKRIYVSRCDQCGRWVRVNGAGSDATVLARAVKWFLNIVKADTQCLFFPAADLHDMQCHKGLNDEELEASNKQFRRNCLALIARRYDDIMRTLSRELKGRPRVSFFQALFSDVARSIWRKQKDMAELVAERKERERDAELYYTALKLFSRDIVPKTKCTERRYEDDCYDQC